MVMALSYSKPTAVNNFMFLILWDMRHKYVLIRTTKYFILFVPGGFVGHKVRNTFPGAHKLLINNCGSESDHG